MDLENTISTSVDLLLAALRGFHPEGEDDEPNGERNSSCGPRSMIVWKRWSRPGSLSARWFGSQATSH